MITLTILGAGGMPAAHGSYETSASTYRKAKGLPPFAYSYSYDELDKGYQYHWEWFFL